MESPPSDRAPFIYESGNLALDLLNTRPISRGRVVDQLPDATQLKAWLVGSGAANRDELDRLSAEDLERLFEFALVLRDALANTVHAFAEAEKASDSDIAIINRALMELRVTTTLARDDRTLQAVAVKERRSVLGFLTPIALAGLELLTEAKPSRVRQCDDTTCVLWFYDTSKGGRRRWCSMARCGNRAKVSAHYRRRRVAAEKESA